MSDSELVKYAWHPNSWEQYSATHIPLYENKQELLACLQSLQAMPPLIDCASIQTLLQQLAEVYERKRFILQAGDCAEKITDCSAAIVQEKVTLLHNMATFVQAALSPLLIGRIAGQYAKPRSLPMEIRGEVTLPSFCGDLVNATEYSVAARKPDAKRLLLAYDASKVVINHINRINNHSPYLYTSHEALHLYYESALTKLIAGNWYNLSTHYPWLGMRTALGSPAHVEYLKGIANPIAVKLGPAMTVDKLLQLIDELNPYNIPGKLTLIHRLGFNRIQAILPSWIAAVQQHKKQVLWMSDPMHGNTEMTAKGIKTRYLDKIMQELEGAFIIHKKYGSFLHGVHLEVTPQQVTECIDNETIFEQDLASMYLSDVDPRLNPQQAYQVMGFVRNYLIKPN